MPDESWCHYKGRVARIERLRRQLAYVRDQADHPDGSVDPVRLALQLQLIAFIEFAEDDAEIKDSIPEMHKLLEALVDLQDGVRNPLLAPRRTKGGRPPP